MNQPGKGSEPRASFCAPEGDDARATRAATIASGLAHRARAGVLAYVLLGLVVAAVTSVREELPRQVLGFGIGLLVIGAGRLVLAFAAPRLIANATRTWTLLFRVTALTAAAYWGI